MTPPFRPLALLLLLSLATPITFASPAFADLPSPEATHAAELKKQGDDLMDALKYADALAVYEQAYAITAAPALLFNEGRALEAMGEYPDALAKLEQFAKVAPPDVLALVPGLDALLADVRSRVGTLVVVCKTPGAHVLVRSKTLGAVTGGERAFPLRAGAADVEVGADGYRPFQRTVEVLGGETKRIEVTLVLELALIEVRVTPEGSLVTVDDSPLGPTPVDAKLASGEHTLTIRREGYEDQRIPITVQAGEQRRLDVTLRHTPPITARWWFWAGVAGVAVGAAAITTALLVDKPASTGTISPGQARAPLTILAF